MKDLKVRVISGVIGVIILIGVLYIGNPILEYAVLLLSIIGLKELFKALENKNLKPLIKSAQIIAIIPLLIKTFLKINKLEIVLYLYLTFVTMYFLLSLLTRNYNIEDIGVTIIGLLYIPYFFSFLSRLSGTKYIGLVFIIAFGTDTFAYFAGNIFGKNKLCPKISPNKTIEGFIGGIIGSVFLTLVFCRVIEVDNLFLFIPLGIIGSIISQLGDLVASVIKRDSEIKDYGKLIPGHGGVLDRFDSVIFTSPIVYFYVKLFIK